MVLSVCFERGTLLSERYSVFPVSPAGNTDKHNDYRNYSCEETVAGFAALVSSWVLRSSSS